MNQAISLPPPRLDSCDPQAILTYYQRAWMLEDRLWKSLVGDEPFYTNPDPLRNVLIFYLGHTAVFYINKLMGVGLIQTGLDSHYEDMFAVGVDPKKPDEIAGQFSRLRSTDLPSVWHYRQAVYDSITALIHRSDFSSPITPAHPLWALMMAMEHQYIHIETSSVLIRQLPITMLKCPDGWEYLPDHDCPRSNEWISVEGGVVHLGKSWNDSTYGWDIDYGYRPLQVEPFQVSKYLITNAEFLEFVKAGGYEIPSYWSADAWQWKTEHHSVHPQFWTADSQTPGTYRYRALFDELAMPLNYPVEINYYEAIAYCRWYGHHSGKHTRLMKEGEWQRIASDLTHHPQSISGYNLDGQFGSPHGVGSLETSRNDIGIYDLNGNVWEWLSDHLTPLPGYEPHFLYPDYSASYFDTQHQMMIGGSWITCGAQAMPSYRNWFRPNFYQHAGFRMVTHSL